MITLSLPAKNGIKSGIRFAVAGLLAFSFYHWFDLQFGYWAVITVAAVMRPNMNMTMKRCLLRLLGTLIGVVLSFISILIIKAVPQLIYVVFFFTMFISGLFIFADKKNSYMGVICGATIIIIITTYNLQPSYFYNVLIDRTLDVIMGILIGSACSRWLLPIKHEEQPERFEGFVYRISLPQFKYALCMALATTLSLIPWFSIHYSGGFWAPTACLMVIEENAAITQKKSLDRFLAQLTILFFTAIISFALNDTYGIGIVLAMGLFILGYFMENPFFGYGSMMANTLAIAFCIVLLYSPGQENTIYTALARFLNTALGLAVGMFVVNIFNKPPAREPKH